MPTPDGPPLDLGRLIAAFDRNGVEYLLCGGAAAAAYGAGRPTEDADCVVRREKSNLDCLARAMRELNARLRVDRMTDDEARLLPVVPMAVPSQTCRSPPGRPMLAPSMCSPVWKPQTADW